MAICAFGMLDLYSVCMHLAACASVCVNCSTLSIAFKSISARFCLGTDLQLCCCCRCCGSFFLYFLFDSFMPAPILAMSLHVVPIVDDTFGVIEKNCKCFKRIFNHLTCIEHVTNYNYYLLLDGVFRCQGTDA